MDIEINQLIQEDHLPPGPQLPSTYPELNLKPKERHSELAVNLAGTMAIFLFKTYKDANVSNQ